MRHVFQCGAFIVLLILQVSLVAQVNTASLTGLVTDQSTAAAPKVRVTVLSEATGYTRSVETDATGYYAFPELPIGTYTVTVGMTGFSTLHEKATLQAAQKVRRDFVLRVGSASETVEVMSAAAGLSPDDASIGTVVDNQVIQQTPLYLRNWDDLLRGVAGVQISRFTQQSGATSAGRSGDFNVHGVHSLQNNFMLDGIDNNTFSENVQELSTEASHPSVDTIEQFNVITNPYSSEYGRSPGAAVSVITKSGTNQLHGVVYEYGRNQLFDATDFFTKRANQKKAENNQHQFGGSLGGPIVKDRLFGFFNYEGTRIKQGVLRISTVPLPNERIGDFSPATAAALGVTYPTIKDPQTGQPFPGNKIPADRIDPVMAKIMAQFPMPNLTVSPVNLNNYNRNNPLVLDNNDGYDGRIDWNPSSSDTVFGRYAYSNRFRFIPGFFGGIADGTSTSAWGRQKLKSHSFVLGWNHVLSSTMLNSFRFGFTRNYSYAEQDPFGKNAASDFVPGVPNNPAVAGGIPIVNFSGGGISTFIGSAAFLPKRQIPQQFQWTDTLSLSLGRHSLKFGATLWAPMRNIFQDEPNTRGNLNFNGSFTGLGYADALLGYVQSAELANVFFVDQRLWMASGFAQDDWKVTPKLTLNLGLRYDFATPALEAGNKLSNFNSVGSGSLMHASSGSMQDRGLVEPNTKNFGPRFGFAYSPLENTVVRGGYGIYYSLFERYGSEDQLSLNLPNLVDNNPAAKNGVPVFLAKNGFPANFLDPNAPDILSRARIRAMNPHDPNGMVQQWSFGVQQQFAADWTADVNYVGTKSTHLATLTDFNQPLIANGVSSGVLPYPNFSYIEYTDFNGYGNYNGLEATLSRRFRQGLNLRVAYTYSRSLDDTPQELESNSGAPPDGRNVSAWYGPSDFDITHRIALSTIYQLPFGHGRAFMNQGLVSKIVGGLQISGVYTFYSGHPFTVNAGGGAVKSALDPFGAAQATPDLIGTPHVVGTPDCWFYSSKNSSCKALAPNLADAYALPIVGHVGSSGRNTLRGPHTSVLDASLTRQFSFGERANLEFRWEVFNVSNTPEFGQPSGDISGGNAGKITSLSGDPRVMQFALRLAF